jgi:hypothetical protein
LVTAKPAKAEIGSHCVADRCIRNVLKYRLHMSFGYADRAVTHRRTDAYDAGDSYRGGVAPLSRCLSRFGYGPASFRHRRDIRFRNFRNLTSHFSLLGAQLCEPGDNAVRRGAAAPRCEHGPLAGYAGTGIATYSGIFVGWEAW